jgi:siroheme synthase
MVDQREVFATLGTLLEAVERAELRAPVVTVISETAGVVRQLDSVVAAAVDSIL